MVNSVEIYYYLWHKRLRKKQSQAVLDKQRSQPPCWRGFRPPAGGGSCYEPIGAPRNELINYYFIIFFAKNKFKVSLSHSLSRKVKSSQGGRGDAGRLVVAMGLRGGGAYMLLFRV